MIEREEKDRNTEGRRAKENENRREEKLRKVRIKRSAERKRLEQGKKENIWKQRKKAKSIRGINGGIDTSVQGRRRRSRRCT